jgi:hypothetical protein
MEPAPTAATADRKLTRRQGILFGALVGAIIGAVGLPLLLRSKNPELAFAELTKLAGWGMLAGIIAGGVIGGVCIAISRVSAEEITEVRTKLNLDELREISSKEIEPFLDPGDFKKEHPHGGDFRLVLHAKNRDCDFFIADFEPREDPLVALHPAWGFIKGRIYSQAIVVFPQAASGMPDFALELKDASRSRSGVGTSFAESHKLLLRGREIKLDRIQGFVLPDNVTNYLARTCNWSLQVATDRLILRQQLKSGIDGKLLPEIIVQALEIRGMLADVAGAQTLPEE